MPLTFHEPSSEGVDESIAAAGSDGDEFDLGERREFTIRSILLIVYSAFSAGVVGGIWSRVDLPSLLLVLALDLAMLVTIIAFVTLAGRKAGLSRGDGVSLLFCGSQKSLATGVPMGNVLFAGTSTGLIILPLMLYHQIQLFVSAAVAQRLANGPEAPTSSN